MNRVYRRGRRLFVRRKLARIASMSVSLALAASGMAFAVGAQHLVNPQKEKTETSAKPAHTPDEPKASHTPDEPKAIVTESPKPKPEPSEKPEQSPKPKPSPSEEPDPKPTLECRNSTNPECGEFHWDPSPGSNAPMSVTFEWSTQEPNAGETVTFTVVADDPDAWIDPWNVKIFYGDGGYEHGSMPGGDCTGRYGPWTPPPRKHGRVELTFTHTYAEAGDYQVKVYAKSAPGCFQPYQSYGEARETMHVQPATDPSPSPSEPV